MHDALSVAPGLEVTQQRLHLFRIYGVYGEFLVKERSLTSGVFVALPIDNNLCGLVLEKPLSHMSVIGRSVDQSICVLTYVSSLATVELLHSGMRAHPQSTRGIRSE